MTDDTTINEPDPHESAESLLAASSIGEVLAELQPDFPDISISKIRFLESRGLIHPHRAPSGYRKFSPDDVAQLRWILTMQRDHFLPLRVIRERLDRGGPLDSDEVEGDPGAVTARSARTISARFEPTGPETEFLDAADLSRLAGLSASQLDELVRFGLVEPTDGERYSRDELRVAKAAGAFLQRGIEARHLRAWRIAAEREAGMLEQIVIPLTKQSAGDATARAREVADELIDMGNAIRESIIVKTLRPSLGFDD